MMTILLFKSEPFNRLSDCSGLKPSAGSGFTLLEVLVAVSIISIVLVSALRLQGQSVTMSETARFYATAPFLAQEKMAEVRFDHKRFIGGESGVFEDSALNLTYHVTLDALEVSSAEDVSLSLFFATVTVSSPVFKSSFVLQDCFHSITGELF